MILNNTETWALLFRWDEYQDWDQIGINVITVHSGKVFRLGIYLAEDTGLIGAKVLQTSELSFTTAGEVKDTIVFRSVPNQTYWLVIAGDSTLADISEINIQNNGVDAPGGTNNAFLSFSNAYTSGDDLPSTLTSPTYQTSARAPGVWLRAQ